MENLANPTTRRYLRHEPDTTDTPAPSSPITKPTATTKDPLWFRALIVSMYITVAIVTALAANEWLQAIQGDPEAHPFYYLGVTAVGWHVFYSVRKLKKQSQPGDK